MLIQKSVTIQKSGPNLNEISIKRPEVTSDQQSIIFVNQATEQESSNAISKMEIHQKTATVERPEFSFGESLKGDKTSTWVPSQCSINFLKWYEVLMSTFVIYKNIHKETRGHFMFYINEVICLSIRRPDVTLCHFTR